MYQLCIDIGGAKHCFPIPSLIDSAHVHIPRPTNSPPLELAIAVRQLVDHAGPELAWELSQVATGSLNK